VAGFTYKLRDYIVFIRNGQLWFFHAFFNISNSSLLRIKLPLEPGRGSDLQIPNTNQKCERSKH
jgi:hypothetical protein